MSAKRIFHLDAVNVLTAANQHVFFSVHDVEEALVIKSTEVTGFDPAIDKRLGGVLWFLPIAFHDIWAFSPDLANRAERQILALITHNAQVTHRHRDAAALGVRLVVLGTDVGEGRRRLSHSPAIAGQGRRKLLLDTRDQFRCCGRAAVRHDLNARQVVLRARRMLENLPCDGRYATDLRAAFALNQGHRLFGVPMMHCHNF